MFHPRTVSLPKLALATCLGVGGCESDIDVDAGALHTCAVTDGGEVRCWGSDSYGQIGTHR